jgi:hypothetical protein
MPKPGIGEIREIPSSGHGRPVRKHDPEVAAVNDAVPVEVAIECAAKQ